MDETNDFKKNEDPGSSRSSIRTYEQDVARAMRERNSSLGSVFLAEQRKRAESKQGTDEVPKKRSGLYFALGALFLILAAGVSYATYYFYISKPVTEVPVGKTYSSAIIPTKEVEINVTGLVSEEINKKIIGVKDSLNSEIGTLASFIILERKSDILVQVPILEFVKKISWRVPGRLERALENPYSLGVYTFEDNNFFAVFGINSYEQAFAGMLEWERLLYEDVGHFFEKDEQVSQVSSLVATTTNATSTAPKEEAVEGLVFSDEVIRNKDVRILKRGDDVILLYSFPDRKTLVIASNPETFKEILGRLSPDRF